MKEDGIETFTGCDEMRNWLAAQGFRLAKDGLQGDLNECNWYAYRRSAIQARECECNDGKPMQIVVRPYKLVHQSIPGGVSESAEVDVTGEAGGVWFKLSAYGLKTNELKERLGDVEAGLIAAWNAIVPEQGKESQDEQRRH
jgi:hypothetical protein